ncbi:response regulator transcription factor [Niastella caeni]|uniref:Response regulator transcription factor n=1 Tax=Niastella caeni TaxID=2569763 RepID=A0A4S8HID0_9BACT|nr:LytTR family DNA-binding domain-containing protein [Niastella caeni]THU34877.1 response regulator transcription factor [Niastella caeni]
MNLTTPLTAPLRVIIVEDMISIRQDLEEFFQQQPDFIIVGACSTVSDAIALIHNTKPDLLLLDIGLPDGTGFDILEQITEKVKVIFLTAHSQYAIQAFRYGAIDYLLKPFNELELMEALQRVINAQPLLREQIAITLHSFRKKKVQDHIALRSQDFVKIVKLKEITYFEADNKYTTVFLNAGNKVVTSKPLKEYDELLSETFFLRTHQSYLLNEFYIDRYHPKGGIIYLKDGTQIPVSERKKEIVDQYLKKL